MAAVKIFNHLEEPIRIKLTNDYEILESADARFITIDAGKQETQFRTQPQVIFINRMMKNETDVRTVLPGTDVHVK